MKILKIAGDTNALVIELRALRARKKVDDKRETVLTTTLKDLAEQQAATLYFDKEIVAMIEEKSATRIDADKLRSGYPDVAEACSVTSSYLTVKPC